MGKTLEKIKMWNILDRQNVLETEAQIDNGATIAIVLPPIMADKLNLKPIGKTRVRYADMRVAERDVVGDLRIEILSRCMSCDAIVEPERDTILVGQFVLEVLDLWIDSKNGKLIPNPASPDMPLLDEL